MIGVIERPFDWALWPQARELLARSAEKSSESTIEEIEEALQGHGILWVNVDQGVRYAAVGQLIKVPEGVQLYVWHGAGELHPYGMDTLLKAEEWARENGCASIEFNGRPGWQKVLPDWKVHSVTLRKTL